MRNARDWLLVFVLRVIVGLTRIFPYQARIKLMSSVIAAIVSFSNSAKTRIDGNIQRVDLGVPSDEIPSFRKAVIKNFALNLAEFYNIRDFSSRTARFHPQGEGLPAFEALLRDGKPAIVVSGHIGQWEAVRAWARTYDRQIAAIYRENSNKYYEEIMAQLYGHNGDAFLTGTRGMAQFVRQLKSGEMVALLHDQRIYKADEYDFMGVPARTSTATAALALKYDVPIVPIYALRRDNGFDYDIIVEPELPRGDEETMTQAMNDNLEKYVREYPTQWYWFHQRWKAKGQNKQTHPA